MKMGITSWGVSFVSINFRVSFLYQSYIKYTLYFSSAHLLDVEFSQAAKQAGARTGMYIPQRATL